MKSLLDPTFQYTPANRTDIRKTFERVRRELEEEKKRREASPHPRTAAQAKMINLGFWKTAMLD